MIGRFFTIKHTCTIMLLSAIIFSFIIQNALMFNSDASYLLHVTKQWLSHGEYGKDIFETNPPMILYLTIPVIGMQKLHLFSVMTTFRLYVLLLATISSGICFLLLKKIIKKENNFLRNITFGAILFVLFFLPLTSFAQREHFFIILTLPYFLLMAMRLNGNQISFTVTFFIGLLAGLAFSLKPFFWVTLGFIELYGMIQSKRFFYWTRTESLVILMVIALYMCSIVIYDQGYVYQVLPFVIKYYFPFNKTAWQHIPLYPFIPFILIILSSYLFFYKVDEYPHVCRIFWLAIIGLSIAFLIPQTPWYYHILPALSFAVILGAIYLGQLSHFFKGHLVWLILTIFFLFNGFYFQMIKVFPQIMGFKDLKEQEIMAKTLKAKQGPQTLTCFLLETRPCFPLVLQIHGEFVGKFPFFWWYNGIRDAKNVDREKDEKDLINIAIKDLTQRQVRWIITKHAVLTYLLQNENFREAFQHYVYYVAINDREIYERIS